MSEYYSVTREGPVMKFTLKTEDGIISVPPEHVVERANLSVTLEAQQEEVLKVIEYLRQAKEDIRKIVEELKKEKEMVLAKIKIPDKIKH